MPGIQVRRGELSRFIMTALIVLFLVSFLSGLVYVVGQQVLRQSANDPQIQMSEDAAAALASGKSLQTVLPAGTVNMQDSLAPYLIVYDDSGKILGSSVELNGATPEVPGGVFGDVRQGGEARFTWQPEPGVRSAAVVTHFSGTTSGFALAGRSLREVEKREDQLLLLVAAGWLAGCGAVVAATILRFFIAMRFRVNTFFP